MRGCSSCAPSSPPTPNEAINGYVDYAVVAAVAAAVTWIATFAVRHLAVRFSIIVLPDDRRVVCGISFGYADHAHLVNSYRTSRAKVADTVIFVEE